MGWGVKSSAVLAPGIAAGEAVVLGEPLSLWGGLDPATGLIIDAHHPQAGMALAGRILVMSGGRGSSSSASVLAEAIRAGTAPAGIILGEEDLILAIGAAVGDELYGVQMPIVVLEVAAIGAIHPGDHVAIGPAGTVTVGPSV